MKRTIKYITILFLVINVMTGCLKILEFEEEDIKPMLVVNCFLSPESNPSIDLTYTVSALDDKDYFESVKNAKLSFDDGESIYTDFKYVNEIDSISKWDYIGQVKYTVYEKGKYENNDAKIESGKSYNIEIEADGFETITAETTIPDAVPIEKIDTFTTYTSDQYSSYKDKKAKIYFTDHPGETNYYRMKIDMAYISFTSTPDDSFTMYPGFYSDYVNSDDPVFGSEDTEDIFGGSSYNRFSIFDDKLFDGRIYGLSMTLQSEYQFTDPGYKNDYKNYSYYIFKINLQTLSQPMYYYLNTVALQENGGMSLISEPVVIYSNVENGAGIFAGFSSSEMYMVSHNLPEELMNYIPKGISNEDLFNYIRKLYEEYSKTYGYQDVYK